MHIYADYHTHSKYSDGRATIKEMVTAASDRGLEALAITDHGPNNIGTGVAQAETFLEIKAEVQSANQHYPGLKLLVGCEADIISTDGEIDVPENIYRQLDLLLVGLHPYALPSNVRDGINYSLANQVARLSSLLQEKVITTNTKALIAAMHKHNISFITHPGLGMPIDTAEVAKTCAATDTAFEINTGHRFPGLEDIITAGREGVTFIVNTDAHFPKTVGAMDYGIDLLERAGIPCDRVMNARNSGGQES